MLFDILVTFEEFEVDLLRMRTREVMAVACAKGRLKGKAQAQTDQTDGPAQALRGDHCTAAAPEIRELVVR